MNKKGRLQWEGRTFQERESFTQKRLIKEFQVRLPELVNKNTDCTVKSEFQLSNVFFQYMLYGIQVKYFFNVVYLELKLNWELQILSGNLNYRN